MATFNNITFKKEDDYMTPKHVWEDIIDYIPKDKIIYEAFYGDGKSGEYLKELGCKNIIHEEIDFYEHCDKLEYDLIVSNPPYSDCKKILSKLKEIDKPFILIMPSSKINTQYFRNCFKNTEMQIIIPKKRISFIKDNKQTKSSNFDCFYYCYKMNLKKDIIWLD
tara:strand:+ start:1119 stop:1613 length:495 start_codon:yes stop_codon:yes gene_type:complete